MTRERSGFKPFRLDDLTGGINVRDYPSEIEDKQSLELENWNFKGNKLVSGPGIDKKYNSPSNTEFNRGITVDGDDIWYINNGSVYKNRDIEYYNNIYVLTVGDIDGKIWSININGTSKTFKFGFYNNEELAKNNLETELKNWLGSGYYVNYDGSGEYTIREDNGAEITFSDPQLVKNITLSDWDDNTKITLTVDGVSVTVDGSMESTVNGALDYLVGELNYSTYYYNSASSGSLPIARRDGTSISISTTEYDRYTYSLSYKYDDTPTSGRFWDYTDVTIDSDIYTVQGSGNRTFNGDYIVDKLFNSETLEDGIIARNNTTASGYKGIRILNNTSSTLTTVTFKYTDGTCKLLADDGTLLDTKTITSSSCTFDYPLEENTYYKIEAELSDGKYYYKTNDFDNGGMFDITSGTVYNIDSIKVEGAILSPSIYTVTTNINTAYQSYSYAYINKLDYSSISITTLNYYTDSITFPPDDLYSDIIETNHVASITISTNTDVTRSVDNNGVQIEENDRYQITVNSLGILLVGSRGLSPVFIDNDGTVNEIGQSSVGSPTIGTIYNGKIILGGYNNSDNIVFSKTYDPVASGNEMLDFSGYSAGSQSISGGNKGTITGFEVSENGLYIFKEEEIWYTNSEKDTGTTFNFIFNKVTSNGAANQNAIAKIDQEIIYFDYKNRAVRRLGYEENLTTLRDVAISREIEDIFQAIPDNDIGNDERYSQLINLSYKYPYLEVNYPDENSPYIFFNLADLNERYRVPDNTIVYNVVNKSWAKRSDKKYEDKYSIFSDKGFYSTDNGDIYNSISGNTLEDGSSLSKEYTTFGAYSYSDDVKYKRFGGIEFVGDLIGDGGEKKIEIEVLIDGENVEIGESDNPYKREIVAADGVTNRFREMIDLYDDGRAIQFKISHSGSGRAIISDVYIKYKTLKVNEYYY